MKPLFIGLSFYLLVLKETLWHQIKSKGVHNLENNPFILNCCQMLLRYMVYAVSSFNIILGVESVSTLVTLMDTVSATLVPFSVSTPRWHCSETHALFTL